MRNREWLDRVRDGTRRRGLPRDYVSRLTEELAEHDLDWRAAHESAADGNAGIGDPDEVVESAVRNFRSDTVFGRHPWFGFLAAPFAVTYLTACLYTVVADGAIELLARLLGRVEHPLVAGADRLVVGASAIVSTVPVCLAVRRWYLRSGRPPAWFVLGCAVSFAASAFLVTQSTPFTDCPINVTVEFGVDSTWSRTSCLVGAVSLVAGLAVRRASEFGPNAAVA